VTALCQARGCGQVIHSPDLVAGSVVNPDPAAARDRDRHNYRQLASLVAVHMTAYHPELAQQISLAMMIAGQSVAMRWVLSSDFAVLDGFREAAIEHLGLILTGEGETPDLAAAATLR